MHTPNAGLNMLKKFYDKKQKKEKKAKNLRLDSNIESKSSKINVFFDDFDSMLQQKLKNLQQSLAKNRFFKFAPKRWSSVNI